MRSYKGIRYARAERYGWPQMEPALTSLDGLEMVVKICPQNTSRLSRIIGRSGDTEEQSEDCLRLSVYTPSNEGHRPVLVWVHGGAFLTGSGLYPKYDATELAEMGQMVVVCISYRLGTLGFLYDPERLPVNLGIADQVCALRWVRENIHLFGGDADKVTVFGQSAGGYSVLHHIANVREPLFCRAIVASAPFIRTSRRQMRRNTRRWYESLGKDPAGCGIDELLEAQEDVARKGIGGMPFSAVGDDICKPHTPAPGLKEVRLWCQQDDALPFVPFRWLTKGVTDLLFRWPMRRYARFLQGKGVDATCSVKKWRHGDSPFGAVHCMELPLIFGNYATWKEAPFMQGVGEQEYNTMAKTMKNEIIEFVSGIAAPSDV